VLVVVKAYVPCSRPDKKSTLSDSKPVRIV
jgi:hypothetical protein